MVDYSTLYVHVLSLETQANFAFCFLGLLSIQPGAQICVAVISSVLHSTNNYLLNQILLNPPYTSTLHNDLFFVIACLSWRK